MTMPTQTIQAIAVSPGISIGRAMRIIGNSHFREPEPQQISPEECDSEIRRFHTALENTRKQMLELESEIRSRLNTREADIFEAHLMLLNDKMLDTEVVKRITDKHFSADYALYLAVEKFAAVFNAMKDDYLRERAADIHDVAARIQDNLANIERTGIELDDRRIIVASSLTPSETVRLDPKKILGFVTETGSATCHTAIIARSMQLPALVGIPPELTEKLTANDRLLLDGYSGKLIINPDSRTEEAYRLKARTAGQFMNELSQEKLLLPETTDGYFCQLCANIDSIDQLTTFKESGAAGVGLFRTEFLFMNRPELPDEEEQFEIYKKLLLSCEDAPVIVRTLDVGGDKFNNVIYRTSEQNPFLGLRGIRLCLQECREIFITQLRALLRAGVYGNLKIMLPMVSSITEILEVRKILEELKLKLAEEKKSFDSRLSLGVMIETPAAAILADRLAPLVDFFSIGTNDLAQYTMAIDRSNERVAYLYRPSHPAILQLIRHTVEAAERNNIFVSVCGQTAADPFLVPLLLGLGVNELSMAPGAIPVIRRVIRSLSKLEAQEMAAKALECSSAAEALELSTDLLRRCAPEIAGLQ